MSKEKNLRVVIIDFQLGNMFSVQHTCSKVGLNSVVTSDKLALKNADAVIFPGVGSFGAAMENLNRLDLVSPIVDFIHSGRPFMGVCLGMQLLFRESEEFGSHRGLGIFDGRVARFGNESSDGQRVKVPQIGWNEIFKADGEKATGWVDSPLRDVAEGTHMYFVHSFYVAPEDNNVTLSKTNYAGTEFCSSIISGNVFATQFHPEKSAEVGKGIYRNWAKSLLRE
ncbi:imidazole glycerol phosphate synthase subunit HisH [Pseudomonadota bacterium]